MYLACATLFLALFTALSALATSRMASHTKALVKKNDDILHQNERHHMDSLKPILVLKPNESSNQFSYRDILPVNSEDAFLGNTVCYNFDANIINIGNGPAFDIVLLLRFKHSHQKELVCKFSPLKAGDPRPLGTVSFLPSDKNSNLFDVDNNFIPREYFMSFPNDVELFIIYKDIYKQKFATKQIIESESSGTILLDGNDLDAHGISHI